MNVYVTYDVDPRGIFGPKMYKMSKNPKTLTTIKPGEDDSPLVPNSKTPQKYLDAQSKTPTKLAGEAL